LPLPLVTGIGILIGGIRMRSFVEGVSLPTWLRETIPLSRQVGVQAGVIPSKVGNDGVVSGKA